MRKLAKLLLNYRYTMKRASSDERHYIAQLFVVLPAVSTLPIIRGLQRERRDTQVMDSLTICSGGVACTEGDKCGDQEESGRFSGR